MKLPLFPLQSVFFPGETVPLHIFEERYKLLINDCRTEAITFGIPVYINDIIAMQVQFPLTPLHKFNSYAFAHKMGLTFEQEYKLLQLTEETERLAYIKTHLETTINVLKQIDRTKAVIEMNGHFKNFDPLDFKDFETN